MSEKKTKLTVIEGGALHSNEAIAEMFPTYANLNLSEAEINALDFSGRCELLSDLNYRHKYQLLRRADDTGELVRSMPAEDLFFTMEVAGRTDAIDLFMEATPAQMTHIFDLTCWHNDDMIAEELLDWLGYMVMIDPSDAMDKLEQLDSEILIAMLSKQIRVHRFEWSDDRRYIDDDSLFSFDDIYLFELLDPENNRNERLSVFLQMLYRLKFDLYQTVMETLVWELSSNLEELTYRAHSDRMSDNGYPEYLDSISLFAPLNPEALRKKVASMSPQPKRVAGGRENVPAFFGKMLDADSFLVRVLLQGDDDLRERIQPELVILGNRILIARKALDDIDKVHDALDEAQYTSSVGLEWLSEQDPKRAGELLLSLPLVEIFRCGYSLVLQLQKKAADFRRNQLEPYGQKIMGLISSPTRETLMALAQRPPLYFEGQSLRQTPISRPFRALAEIEKVQVLLARIEFLFDLHFRLLAQDIKQILQGHAPINLEPLDPDIRFVKIFLTLCAHGLQGQEAAYRPLDTDSFEAFLTQWLEPRSEGGFQVREELYAEVQTWLNRYLAAESEQYQYLAQQWAQRTVGVLNQLAAELRELSSRMAISLSQVLLLG